MNTSLWPNQLLLTYNHHCLIDYFLHNQYHFDRNYFRRRCNPLPQEGRGIGLAKKIEAYHLMESEGMDTVEANEHMGFEADLREYSAAAKILRALSVKQVRLLTNNPGKVEGLEENGVQVTQRVPLELGVGPVNINYLKTKKTKFGHTFETI